MSLQQTVSRRQFLQSSAVASVLATAGCAGGGDESTTDTASTDTTDSEPITETPGTSSPTGLAGAIEQAATPVELTATDDGLDAVAATLAAAPVVGIGETSHGISEFKSAPHQLTRRLVTDHGYRLVAIEGTLGDLAPVNDYVTGADRDLDAVVADLDFYFWRTAEVRALFEWLREFNSGRPDDDTVTVRGYDAQFYDVNATAIRDYLQQVDPDYLAAVDETLAPLTSRDHDSAGEQYLTEARAALIEDLRSRLEARQQAYVDATSEADWQLTRRHVWTLERGLQFMDELAAENFAAGKDIRDAAMAENVTWLREWAGADRAVVLGNANHTMAGYGHENQQGARMGQHLRERYGDQYYSLGLLFGTGQFSGPTNAHRTEFETYTLDGPVDGTLAATLAEASQPQLFLDFETAREQAQLEDRLADTEKMQFTVPRVAARGAVPLPVRPGEVLDGALYVDTVSAASFDVSG